MCPPGSGVVARLERQVAEVVQRADLARPVTELPADLERLAEEPLRRRYVDQCVSDRAGPHACGRAQDGLLMAGGGQGGFEAAPSLAEIPTDVPEPPRRGDESERELAVLRSLRVVQRCPDVVVASGDLRKRCDLVGARRAFVRLGDHGEHVLRMPLPDRVCVGPLHRAPRESELADRRQDREASHAS